jgi:DNA-binding CsgD family transcriptional regulator
VPAAPTPRSLTLREREVLWWAAQGKSARTPKMPFTSSAS